MLAISKTGFFAKKNTNMEKKPIPEHEIRFPCRDPHVESEPPEPLPETCVWLIAPDQFSGRATVSTAHIPRLAVVRIVIEFSVRFRG